MKVVTLEGLAYFLSKLRELFVSKAELDDSITTITSEEIDEIISSVE